MTLGSSVVKGIFSIDHFVILTVLSVNCIRLFCLNLLFKSLGLLPRMILLWRNAFPKNIKELDSEKARGDAFTWKVSLEGRAGALAVMHSFLEVSTDFVIDEFI